MKNSLILLTVGWVMTLLGFAQSNSWDKGVGEPAPRLVSAGWVGAPVSLESVRGNTVVLGFWNADIAC